jgi:hypothetical protein
MRLGVHKSLATKFCTLVPNIVGEIITVLLLSAKNVYQCICTKQKALDVSKVHRSLQNWGSQHRTSFI